jgi:hypothetical protein
MALFSLYLLFVLLCTILANESPDLQNAIASNAPNPEAMMCTPGLEDSELRRIQEMNLLIGASCAPQCERLLDGYGGPQFCRPYCKNIVKKCENHCQKLQENSDIAAFCYIPCKNIEYRANGKPLFELLSFVIILCLMLGAMYLMCLNVDAQRQQ